MNKKIVILGPAYPLRGGIASYNERLFKALFSQGYDVRIESFRLQYPSILFPGKTQYSNSSPPENIKIVSTINSINPLNWIKIGYKLKKENPDILIIRYWLPFMGLCLGTIARIIKKNSFTKIISIVDNIIPHEKRYGDKLLTKYFIKPIDGFIVMSNTVMEDLLSFDTHKPKILSPHPLYDNFGNIIDKETARKFLHISNDKYLILFFGLIRDYKGLDILLKALAIEELKNFNIKLMVAGEFYSDASYYYNLVKELNLEDKVIFTNSFIPDEEVAYYFCASDLVVQPYKTATQSGITPLAYHFNIPIIVTSVGGLAEMVPNNVVGYVVNPEPLSIAQAIIKYFKENKREKFINNIIIEKQKYLWDNMVKAIEELANKIKK
ncbi:MAG TPA: glycosyltransferase family 4 protein [Bacteroidales bacterium]|nr:glycosyltransferase family 4 protein [Bacteroidales bacterium]